MRTDSKSALDFTYWVLENMEENYLPSDALAVYQPSPDASLMHRTIVDMSLICGVTTPRTFSALLAKVDRYETRIDPLKAMRTRGAVLYKGESLHVSLGDKTRLVGIDINGAISVYCTGELEFQPDHWDGAFELPEMRYL